MSIQELMPILQQVSADIIIFSILTFIITNLIKKKIPDKYSNTISILPFFIGIIFSLISTLLYKTKIDLMTILMKGVQIGGVATFIYAFIKQLLKEKGLEKNIGNILKGLLDSQTIKGAVKKITSLYEKDTSDEENVLLISKIISENTSFSENECKTISEIVLNAIKGK
jgi:hypothetical protein